MVSIFKNLNKRNNGKNRPLLFFINRPVLIKKSQIPVDHGALIPKIFKLQPSHSRLRHHYFRLMLS